MEHKKNWMEYMATVKDIEQFLRDNIYLRHNVITGRVECRIPQRDCFSEYTAEDLTSNQWVQLSDRIVNMLWRVLSKEKKVRADDLHRVIESDFVESYNPFTYYLEHLPPWDGLDHILVMSTSVSVKGTTDDQLLFADCLKKWMVWMVAGWVDPQVVNHVILVLIGRQGSYKTTWFNYILPPPLQQYFRIKTNSSRMSKDDLIALSEYGLVCCEELDTMRPSELNQLKAAVTMQSVDERRPYGHYTEHRPHIASFCGTGNNIQFLSDSTGNRRWLPFEVESIESPREHPFDYEGIYSQAYALYQQGFRYWLSDEESQLLAEHNKQFEAPRLEYELIDMYFRRPNGNEVGTFMPVAHALQLVGANIAQKLSVFSLGRAFRDMGFMQVVRNHVRGYLVVQRSPEEIKIRQRMSVTDVTDETEVF